MNNLDWEKLRYFITVAKAGKLTEAAKRLNVNHATVFRQLNQFEKDIKARLFIRSRDGYKLTDIGEELLKNALLVEEQVLTLEREILGRDLELSGNIRVTTTDTLAAHYLSKHLVSFRQEFPRVTVELSSGHAMFNLNRREADVAIRSSVAPKGDIVGRRVCALAFSVYGHRKLLQGLPSPKLENQFSDLPFLELDPSFSELASYRWLQKHKTLSRAGLRCNSLVGLLDLAAHAGGLAVLPCFMADPLKDLVRLSKPDPQLGADLWILTNREFKENSRIRAFMDHMHSALKADKALFEGRS